MKFKHRVLDTYTFLLIKFRSVVSEELYLQNERMTDWFIDWEIGQKHLTPHNFLHGV